MKGSSPRMRGKRVEHDPRDHCRRLIPAYAGKTRKISAAGTWSRAHPRVCGENDPRRV